MDEFPNDCFVKAYVPPRVGLVYEDHHHFLGPVHTCALLPCRFATIAYILGSASNVRNSVDNRPPTTTVARGRCTSDPIPEALAAGTIPSSATSTIIKTGRIWASEP